MYKWYTVADNRNIAPLGWHVPTQAELISLIDYMGSESIAGGKMKEAGFAHWNSPNTGADNSSGLTFLAAGDRTANFENFGEYITIWSSTSRVIPWAIGIQLNNTSPGVMWAEFNKWFGFSVRCIKD